MPRRMIDPQIWRNEKVGSLPDAGRLLFIGIFSQADDDGRLKASPRFLMASIFPYDKDKTEEDIKLYRDQCAKLGLIQVYTNGKEEYLNIPGWKEHQHIRKDRYVKSSLPSFDESKEFMTTTGQPNDNQVTPTGQPNDNQVTTIGQPSIVKFSIVKSSIGTPKGGCKKLQPNPIISQILAEMKTHLGYPCESSVCGGEALPAIEENQAMTAERSIDPIPNYGKEGRSIKRMLTRGFTREEILACWKSKVDQRGGEFVSMAWVNEDIQGFTHGRLHGGEQKSKGGRKSIVLDQDPDKYIKGPYGHMVKR